MLYFVVVIFSVSYLRFNFFNFLTFVFGLSPLPPKIHVNNDYVSLCVGYPVTQKMAPHGRQRKRERDME